MSELVTAVEWDKYIKSIEDSKFTIIVDWILKIDIQNQRSLSLRDAFDGISRKSNWKSTGRSKFLATFQQKNERRAYYTNNT